MSQPILFVDRDGTLIEEPADFQIDRYEKLRFVEGVIPAMLRLRDAGYEFVMVTNQNGLGTESFPQADFDAPHALMMQVLESQGIRFREVLIDPSFAHDPLPTRKPAVGLVMHYLRKRSFDPQRSAMIGDRDTDIQFAQNMGIRGFKLKSPQFGEGLAWSQIPAAVLGGTRAARVERSTNETKIVASVDLDAAGPQKIETGIGFFDHMLEQLGKHGGFALAVDCEGDLHVDEHHTVEDCALAIGQALKQALGDKRGIGRYGFTLPMDEALATAALDLSGRAYFVFDGEFEREQVGGLATELVSHFFRSLCDAAGINLHLTVEGENDHHMIEACFKVVGRALRQAIRRDGVELPSTKGQL